MDNDFRHQRRWRRVKATVKAMFVGGLLGLAVVWFVFQHKPAWYRPATLDEAGVRDASAEAITWADDISDQMVRGRPFEVALEASEVNRFLAALPALFPEEFEHWPRELSRPAVAFEDGVVKCALHVERNGWRFLAVGHFETGISEPGRRVHLTLASARAGSLPLSLELLRLTGAAFGRRDGEQGAELSGASGSLNSAWTFDDLLEGIELENRFVWPNGKRPFRVERLSVDGGRLHVVVRPL